MRIALIAALPGELKPLVRGWQSIANLPGGIRMWRRPPGSNEVVAVCAGMGMPAARRAFAAAEFAGALDQVVSLGWAGALTPAANTAAAHFVSEIIDAQTGERFRLPTPAPALRLVTAAHVADAPEKQRLATTYTAALVDMEAAAVARLAEIRGIPMHCLKAVSDDPDAGLPDLNPFIDPSGQLKLARFLAHVALRPAFWLPLVALGRRSAQAADALAATLQSFLAEQDQATLQKEPSRCP